MARNTVLPNLSLLGRMVVSINWEPLEGVGLRKVMIYEYVNLKLEGFLLSDGIIKCLYRAGVCNTPI